MTPGSTLKTGQRTKLFKYLPYFVALFQIVISKYAVVDQTGHLLSLGDQAILLNEQDQVDYQLPPKKYMKAKGKKIVSSAKRQTF